MENIARYIIRASFSQERMTYIPEQSEVVYQSKDGKKAKTFDALEWLASMCSHVPNRSEQMVRYYGYYSNVSRGKRKKENQEDVIPHIIEDSTLSPAQCKSWARLIQKTYEVDPLTCPKCRGKMKTIAFIDQPRFIKKILQHVGLWNAPQRPPPGTTSPPSERYVEEQVPSYDYADPDYQLDKLRIVDFDSSEILKDTQGQKH